jgi:hypothetical protein
VLGLLRAHPVLTTLVVVCIVVGVALAFRLGPTDWPTWRKVAAGVIGGSFVGYIITLTRMMGAYSGSEDEM